MSIKVNGRILNLRQGDEIVIFPGAAHEVISCGAFLARVRAVNCHGDGDKYKA